jgi:hypothetical protein
MDVYVPCIVDKSPARDLELRGRVKERHEGKEQVLKDHEAKLLIAVLLMSKMHAYFTACRAYFRILLFNSISVPERFKFTKLFQNLGHEHSRNKLHRRTQAERSYKIQMHPT